MTAQATEPAKPGMTRPARIAPSGTSTMFMLCPACLEQDGAVRCGRPAGVTSRFITYSSDGPLESVMIRCPSGHWFNGPIGFLTPDSGHKHGPGHAAAAFCAGRDSRMAGRAGRDGDGGSSRRNNAPAYYLGRPARLWITAMGPRRERTAPAHLADAVTGG
jgi:hypothetical protein